MRVILVRGPFVPVVQKILPLSSYPPNFCAPLSPGVQSMMLCYSHRIIEYFKLEGIFKGHIVQSQSRITVH